MDLRHPLRRRTSAWPVATLWIAFAAAVIVAYPQTQIPAPNSPVPPTKSTAATTPEEKPSIKPDAKKAKAAFQIAAAAEKQQDWATAFENYSRAAEYAPQNHDYAIRRENAKAALVQAHVAAAERAAVANRMDDARRELLIAQDLDPTNTVIRERLAEFLATIPVAERAKPEFSSGPQLNIPNGKHSFDYRGDTRGAYDEIARQFGLRDAFDPALVARPIRFVAADVDFPTAMRILGTITDSFWRPLTDRIFLVADDTPQKRRDLGPEAIQTILLPASATSEQMTETLRVMRDISGITRANLDTSARAITLRASPQALAVASSVVDGIEQPLGEMVLEIEVLEVDKNRARQLGITPPEGIQGYTLSPQQIEEANQSAANLVAVISQVFGLPSSLSGLTPSQIAGLLASGNLNAGSLIPPLVAFGGGKTTFLATLPGASANFGEMLGLVKHGMRVFLRAEDGTPATAFFGEHFPVSLANYSSSLGGATIPGVSSSNFPTTNYLAGNGPQYITSAILRTSSAINDLIAANSQSGTVSVFLGNGVTQGDGTFADQVTYRTDPATTNSQPTWIATADLDGDDHPDLIVANKASNNIGVLLGNPVGDGTFEPATTFATGTAPVSVVAALFDSKATDTIGSHMDLAVANQDENTISIFRGKGDGTFVMPPTTLQLPGGYQPAGMIAEDLNADGLPDLVVVDEGNNTISVFLGNGDGTFQPRKDYDTGQSPVAVAAGDLNADGIIDLAVANNGTPTATNSGNSVSIYLGQKDPTTGKANGTFLPAATRDYPAGTAPTSILIGDFNVDGFQDLVVADGNTASAGTAGDNAISVLLGGGDGSFSSNLELPVGTNPQSIVSEDFNDDSKPDLAAANFGSNNITVVLNSSSVFNGSSSSNLGSLGTPYPNVQYVDLGLKIKAMPRIHADNEVTLNLDFSLTSIANVSFNSIPAINNETLQHSVRLKQDESTVIASFLAPQNTNNIAGTPGIAGLPGLGWLAQNQNLGDQDTEIIFLVTPRMVRYPTRDNRVIYAGQGALEGGASTPAAAPIFNNAPATPPPGAADQSQTTPNTVAPGTPLPAPPNSAQPGQPSDQNQGQPNSQPPPSPAPPFTPPPDNPNPPQPAPDRPIIE